MRSLILLAACFLACLAVCRADDSRNALRAIATTDSSEVHPDDVFEVTLSLENLTSTVQRIKIPECGWDRVWKSSNRRVTWDAWDCDEDRDITVEIPPGQTYVFPKTLKMFVDSSVKQSRIDFRMGFRTVAFGRTLWSTPITLDVTP